MNNKHETSYKWTPRRIWRSSLEGRAACRPCQSCSIIKVIIVRIVDYREECVKLGMVTAKAPAVLAGRPRLDFRHVAREIIPPRKEYPPRFAGVSLASLSLLALVPLLSCSAQTTVPDVPEPSPDPVLIIDSSPAWSADGATVAFHRSLHSQYGPPGIYEVMPATGDVRFISAGGRGGPANLRYSPDGSQLAADWGGQVILIDVATGDKHQLTHTDNIAVEPEWSPDGLKIVYARAVLEAGEPPDSAGLWIYDVESEVHAPLRGPSGPVFGGRPRWSGYHDLIAFDFAAAIHTIRPDGTGLRQVSVPQSGLIHDFPRWVFGEREILYREAAGSHRKNWLVDPASNGRREWPVYIGCSEAISPDDRYVVLLRVDPANIDRSVLFIQELGDESRESARQLTFFVPPDSRDIAVLSE